MPKNDGSEIAELNELNAIDIQLMKAQAGDLGHQARAGFKTVERLVAQIKKYPHVIANDADLFEELVGADYFLRTGHLLKGDDSD
jgi:hypothetical protein